MPLTEQQAAAIETRHVSIALAAGAGCGKTFVLTQRFVSELLREPSADMLDRLMAITFTDRAAREMRDRIRERVREELQQCPDHQVSAWQEILRDLETARIQTIHSFCTATLRRYSTELGIDPEFTVLDEATASALLAETVESSLTRFLRDKNPDAMNLVLRYGLEGTLRHLQSFVRQRFQLREAVGIAAREAELVEFWKQLHGQQYLPMKLEELANAPEVATLFELFQHEETSSQKMQQRRVILLQHLGTLLREQKLDEEALTELRGAATVQYAGKKNWSDEEIYETARDQLKSFRDRIDKLLPMMSLDPEGLDQAARFGMQLLRLSEEAVRSFQRKKQDQAALDFDDLLLMMRDLIQSNETVRSGLRKRTRFLMLDEFQDTDPVQTEIVRAICGERLTEGGLFLVGDVKQSIYRFRRADPAVFRELRREIPPAGQMSLTRNFRSQQGVLDFVNFVFHSAMDDDYDALTAFDEREHPPAEKVEFLWADDPERERDNVGEQRQLEAEWIAARIQELLDDETPRIRDRNEQGETFLRPVRPGDITILFRAFSNLGDYEDALRKAGLDYYVVGGRAFFAQQEIYDLVNLCNFLDDESDEIALVGILRSPMFGWSDESLFHVAWGESLWPSLRDGDWPPLSDPEQQACVQRTREILLELMNLRNRIGIGPLLRYAISATAYDAALMTEFLGERKVANLQKLLTMADQFDQLGLLGLSEFSERLLESIAEESKEELAATHAETGDVIRLMTVHQSKGLEFPVVVVADLNRRKNASTDSAVLQPNLGPLVTLPLIKGEKRDNPAMKMFRDFERREDEAESIRLFYVATTRAADLLILSAYWNPDETKPGPWLALLLDRFNLSTGLPREDPHLGQIQQPGIDRERIPQIHVWQKKPQRKSRTSRNRKLRLNDWEEQLARSEPVTPPAIALPLPVPQVPRRRYSVSELEELDASFPTGHEAVPVSGKSSPPGNSPDLKTAEVLGHLLHAALEHFHPDQPAEAARIIEMVAGPFREELTEEIREQAINRLQTVLEADFLRELQQARQLHRETEFLLRWPTTNSTTNAPLISGTIDCLLQDDTGQWHLIDYKTGHVPDDPAKVLEKFGIQMTLYLLAIEQMTGQRPATIRILQLADTVRSVPLELDAKNVKKFQTRIDRIFNRR